MLRIDIPFPSGIVTEYYGGSSLYALTPLTEEVCKDNIGNQDPRPVNPMAYRIEDRRNEEPLEYMP
jgi:hypothetical protein